VMPLWPTGQPINRSTSSDILALRAAFFLA
jgi:hypothetical protein